MNISVQSLIDDKLNIKSDHKRSGKWSPSQFGGCLRKQFYHRKDEPQSNPPDSRSLRVFKAGDLFHDFVQSLLIDKGYQSEVLIETDDVKGFADLVNHDEVADIKSVHSKSFWYMTKTDNIKEEKYHNWLQVMWYAIELKKQYARLVFVSKDDLCIQEYRLEVDNYWRKEVSKELDTLRKVWVEGVLPEAKPRLFGKDKNGTPKECSYCNWLDKCKGEEVCLFQK